MNMAEMAEMERWQDEMLEKHGFYIHYVPDGHGSYVDCHTHGLVQTFDHPEFQIVLPLSQRVAIGVMHNLVDQVRGGSRFEDQDMVDNVIDNFQVMLIKSKDDAGNEVLRVIFPDPNGYFPEDKSCDLWYAGQVFAE